MLSARDIGNILVRLGIDDLNVGNIQSDESGDFISCFDPDMDFMKVRKSILSKVIFRKKVINQGFSSIEIEDTLWFDGNKTRIKVLFEKGLGGFGTVVKVCVSYVEAVINGELKRFLSFEDYKNYSESFESSED